MNKYPHLEVITGPMFSGKTTELVRRLRRAEYAGLKTLLFRPEIDHTKLTHDGEQWSYLPLKNEQAWFGGWTNVVNTYDVVAFDEVQFLDAHLEDILWLSNYISVIVSGLDTTYRYEPFSIVPQLMAYAERVDKLTAICVKCGEDATRTQRVVNGAPAKATDATILVGDDDFYEARCSQCWELG